MDAKLMSEKEAALELNLSRRTLQAWRMRGGGPKFVKLGASVRYRREVLLAWIEEQSRASTSAKAAPSLRGEYLVRAPLWEAA